MVFTLRLCVLYGSQNKQRLLPLTQYSRLVLYNRGRKCLLRGTDSVLKCPIHSQFNLTTLLWRRIWRKNWINCADMTGNSAGLRNALSSRLPHRELLSSLREFHSFRSLPADTMMIYEQEDTQNWQKAEKLDGKLCCAREHSVQFFVQFF
jgi:hypothetical protein